MSVPARADVDTRRACAVTGASGYVGSRVAAHLADVGWEVRALCRQRPNVYGSHVSHVPFELASGAPREALQGVAALVHAAYDFGGTRWSDVARVNVEGSRRLFAAAREDGVDRIVFVSTVAAFPGARSVYGRAKLEIERIATGMGATVIRPGLVWGPEGAAMFGALRGAVEHLPVVPVIHARGLELRLVHEEDLARLVERLLAHWPERPERLFVAASEETLTLITLLRALALQAGKRRYFVSIPWVLPWLALRALEALGMRPPFRSDSLLSLVNADRDPLARATGSAERYGVKFRAYSLT